MTWEEWMWIQSAVTPAEIHSRNGFFLYWIWKGPVFLGTYRLRSSSIMSYLLFVRTVFSTEWWETITLTTLHSSLDLRKTGGGIKSLCLSYHVLWVCPCSLSQYHTLYTNREKEFATGSASETKSWSLIRLIHPPRFWLKKFSSFFWASCIITL